jgi:CubicO group peptidase (beta-lactamase class C family)
MKRILTVLLLMAIGGYVSAQSVKEKLDEYCRAAEATGHFHGTVLVKQKGQTVLSSGYGFADADKQIKSDENTIYQVGSVTKQFTSSIILKLAEQGWISITDKLSKFYPSFPKADKVTIEQLLSHTSGIKSYTAETKLFDSIKTVPVSEQFMVNLFASFPYDFEPGTNWSYSNSAYSLLGYIIQKVTKKSYEQNVRELILQPLGMNHSGFDFRHLPSGKAIGYYNIEKGNNIPSSLVDSTVSFAAGALYTSAAELSKWNTAVFSGKVISPSSLDNALHERKNKYGLGWGMDTLYHKRVIQHGGGIDGFLCQNYVVPGDDIQVIVLENAASYDPGKVCTDLLGIVLGETVALPETIQKIEVDPAKLKELEGEYEIKPGMTATILIKEGKLMVDTHNDPLTELLPKSESVFAFSNMAATLEFFRDNAGKVEKFVFREGNHTMEAKKIK